MTDSEVATDLALTSSTLLRAPKRLQRNQATCHGKVATFPAFALIGLPPPHGHLDSIPFRCGYQLPPRLRPNPVTFHVNMPATQLRHHRDCR